MWFVGHNDACSMPALAAELDDKLSKTIQGSLSFLAKHAAYTKQLHTTFLL